MLEQKVLNLTKIGYILELKSNGGDKNMKFDEYLKVVVPKIGPNSAFDLSRDARMTALESILIEKEIAIKEEIEAEVEKQLGESAHNIANMPPIPSESKKNGSK